MKKLLLITISLLALKVNTASAMDGSPLTNSRLMGTQGKPTHQIISITPITNGTAEEYKDLAAVPPIKVPFQEDNFYSYYPKTEDNEKESFNQNVNIKIGDAYLEDSSSQAVISALISDFKIDHDSNVVNGRGKALDVTALFNAISSNGGYTYIAKTINPKTIVKTFIQDVRNFDQKRHDDIVKEAAQYEPVQDAVFSNFHEKSDETATNAEKSHREHMKKAVLNKFALRLNDPKNSLNDDEINVVKNVYKDLQDKVRTVNEKKHHTQEFYSVYDVLYTHFMKKYQGDVLLNNNIGTAAVQAYKDSQSVFRRHAGKVAILNNGLWGAALTGLLYVSNEKFKCSVRSTFEKLAQSFFKRTA